MAHGVTEATEVTHNVTEVPTAQRGDGGIVYRFLTIIFG